MCCFCPALAKFVLNVRVESELIGIMFLKSTVYFRIILDLYKRTPIVQSSQPSFAPFPVMLNSYITRVHTSKLKNRYCTWLYSRLYSNFTSSSTNVLFTFQDPTQEPTFGMGWVLKNDHLFNEVWGHFSNYQLLVWMSEGTGNSSPHSTFSLDKVLFVSLFRLISINSYISLLLWTLFIRIFHL